MKIGRAWAIAKKEVFHISRDPFTLAMALLLPVIMVTVFGLAIEFNVKNIQIAVYDGDHTQATRKLLDTVGSSGYFLLDGAHSPFRAIQRVDAEHDRAALIIEPRFEYDLLSGRSARAQVILDGSDNSTIGSIISYFGSMQSLAAKKITGKTTPDAVTLKTRFLYNPELNSRWFIVPGLMVVVLGILSILLTALTIAREWENGSMELLLSTPVQPVEIILGKLGPYIALGLGAIVFVYVMARLGFGVPFRGNYLIFFLGCSLFLTTYLAQGLLISVLTRRQQLAMQFSMMTGLLPSMLLSGFIFPIESMPLFFRILTCALPARWFMIICRDVFLKGSNLFDLRYSFLALAIISAVMVTVASRNFKKDLEP